MKPYPTIIHCTRPLQSLSFLLLLPAALAATPEKPKSVFWEPYRYDGSTAGLYHFDEEETSGVESGLEDPESGETGGPELELLSSEKGEGRAAANAVLSGEKMELVGDCRRVAGKGRFGGGLFFEGTDGRIVGEMPGGARTLEFWMRPEKLTSEAVTVAHISAIPRSKAIVLRLLRDGTLELDWAGQAQRVPGHKLRENQWAHMALAWDGHERCEFRLDGNIVPLEKALQPSGTEKLTHYVVSNDPIGESGFRGVIDEVRVSNVIREYYRHTFGWTKTDERIVAKGGQPFFRDVRDLVFHMDFNRTLIPVVSPPDTVAPEDVGETRGRLQFMDPEKPRPPFTDGIERQAAVVGKDGVTLEYFGPGLFSPERGTIALWIRPLNWNNYVQWNPFAPFAMKTVPVFVVYSGEKDRVGQLTFFQTPNIEAWQHPVDLNPGRWVHLCLTWEKGLRATYLDGKPWPYWGAWAWEVKPWDTGKKLTLRFGRDESLCALDDFRVYRRALSPAEAANLAALFDPRKEVLSLLPLEMTFDFNGVLGRVDVELFPLSPDYEKVDNALVTVTAKGGDEPIGQQELKFNGCPEARGRVNSPPMEFTTYEVKAVARDALGQPVCEAVTTFERKPPPWWQNKLGVSDKVMPGWTPVQVKDKTLSVVLRDIRFSDAGMPESVISAGADVLAGPVALTATVGGKAETLSPVPGAFHSETKGEVRADFAGQAVGAVIKAGIQGTIEFDGMMWFTVTLRPALDAQAPTLDAFSMRIPYAEEQASLLHWWSGNHWFRNPHVVHIGATPAGEGVVFRSTDKSRVALYQPDRWSFLPYVMLTGDRRGMAWFAENDRGWTQSRDKPAVVIERQSKTVTLVLNVITDPVELTGPRAFEFGLHPIPVKPLEKGWRMTPSWGVLPDSFCGFNLKGPQPTQFYRHPENMDWDMVARRFRGELGSQGAAHREPQGISGFRREFGRDPKPRELMVVGLYHDLSGIAAFPEHTREWGGEVWWHRRYTPDMIDYCAWIWNEWVRRGFAKGIYYDNCFNYPLDAWPTPVTYKRPDGTIQPGFQWRQIREHLKRTRQVFHDNGLVPHLCAHTTHTLFIPYHSFFDVILDGEDFYQSPGEKRDFIDSWPPDRMRFMNPEKWGLITTWLGWYQGAGEDWPKFKTLFWQHWRSYTAALLVNDIGWTVGHLGGRFEVDRDWLKESRLCLDPETEFVPYWDSRGMATHAQKNLYVSSWNRNGLCVVALVNWSMERIEAEVTLDPKAMGFGNASTDSVKIRDVDSSLLSYFDDDVTRLKPPDAESLAQTALLGPTDTAKGEELEAGTGNEEDELDELGFKKKITPEERRAKDPDGKFTWKDGVLKCPVRPHDFRLFEFRVQ